jgi:DNA-binding transcriptional MerR regulator
MSLEDDIEKRYYSIREVASLLGISASVLRFWEKEFPDLKPRKSRGGHRFYTPEDVETLRNIYYLVKVKKFTLQGAREKLRLNPQDVSHSARTRDALLRIRELVVQLREALPER